MDQIKIGRFIQERRKENGLTQLQLAELLGITDRAISKWETGRTLPDSSIMLELCAILKISVNDLLSGEVISMFVISAPLTHPTHPASSNTASSTVIIFQIFILN